MSSSGVAWTEAEEGVIAEETAGERDGLGTGTTDAEGETSVPALGVAERAALGVAEGTTGAGGGAGTVS